MRESMLLVKAFGAQKSLVFVQRAQSREGARGAPRGWSRGGATHTAPRDCAAAAADRRDAGAALFSCFQHPLRHVWCCCCRFPLSFWAWHRHAGGRLERAVAHCLAARVTSSRVSKPPATRTGRRTTRTRRRQPFWRRGRSFAPAHSSAHRPPHPLRCVPAASSASRARPPSDATRVACRPQPQTLQRAVPGPARRSAAVSRGLLGQGTRCRRSARLGPAPWARRAWAPGLGRGGRARSSRRQLAAAPGLGHASPSRPVQSSSPSFPDARASRT